MCLLREVSRDVCTVMSHVICHGMCYDTVPTLTRHCNVVCVLCVLCAVCLLHATLQCGVRCVLDPRARAQAQRHESRAHRAASRSAIAAIATSATIDCDVAAAAAANGATRDATRSRGSSEPLARSPGARGPSHEGQGGCHVLRRNGMELNDARGACGARGQGAAGRTAREGKRASRRQHKPNGRMQI